MPVLGHLLYVLTQCIYIITTYNNLSGHIYFLTVSVTVTIEDIPVKLRSNDTDFQVLFVYMKFLFTPILQRNSIYLESKFLNNLRRLTIKNRVFY